MALFTAECRGYQNALDLIDRLKLAGIDSNITAGGVAVHITPDQLQQAQALCRELGCSFDPGVSGHQQEVLMMSDAGFEALKRVTDDAIAVLKEWS